MRGVLTRAVGSLVAGVLVVPAAAAGPVWAAGGEQPRSANRAAGAAEAGGHGDADRRHAGRHQHRAASSTPAERRAAATAAKRSRAAAASRPEPTTTTTASRQRSGPPGSPPGNNGTVKVWAPTGATGTPDNTPQPGCTVGVEWFGFDAGDDVISTVSFTPMAPTDDITVTTDAPTSVFVGGDPARGGRDLDGTQTYPLTITGDPHPQRGYHLKVVVDTPRSNGATTKSKVLWVDGCAPDQDTAPGDDDGTDGPVGVLEFGAPGADVAADEGTADTDADAGARADVLGAELARVLGAQVFAEEQTGPAEDGLVMTADVLGATDGEVLGAETVAAPAQAARVAPTGVDAGLAEKAAAWFRSSGPLWVAGLGMLAAAAAVGYRRRVLR